MRLMIQIDTDNETIPFEYHGFLQAAIYRGLGIEKGKFYHNEGYALNNRFYKMFVFSELRGKYLPAERGLRFIDYPKFYISSVDSDFLNRLFQYYDEKKQIQIGKKSFDIVEIGPVEDLIYHKNHEYRIKTISPVTCYKTDEKHFVNYYHPKSMDFESSIENNLQRKSTILNMYTEDDYFAINSVQYAKLKKVKFKGGLIHAYDCCMDVSASDHYLKLLLHTGIGAKNSSGFGMVKVI